MLARFRKRRRGVYEERQSARRGVSIERTEREMRRVVPGGVREKRGVRRALGGK